MGSGQCRLGITSAAAAKGVTENKVCLTPKPVTVLDASWIRAKAIGHPPPYVPQNSSPLFPARRVLSLERKYS